MSWGSHVALFSQIKGVPALLLSEDISTEMLAL